MLAIYIMLLGVIQTSAHLAPLLRREEKRPVRLPITCRTESGKMDEREELESTVDELVATKLQDGMSTDMNTFCDASLCQQGQLYQSVAARHRCIVALTHHRCLVEAGEASKGQSMSCFLSEMARKGTSREVYRDIIAENENVKQKRAELFRREHPLACMGTKNMCNPGASAEERYGTAWKTGIKTLATDKCAAQLKEETNDAWGPPKVIPSWFLPRVSCDHATEVTVLARRLRVAYMQHWFIDMERELDEGENHWFVTSIAAFHKTGVSPKPESAPYVPSTDATGASILEVDAKQPTLDAYLGILTRLDKERDHHDIFSPSIKMHSITAFAYDKVASEVHSSQPKLNSDALGNGVDPDLAMGKIWARYGDDPNVRMPAVLGYSKWKRYLNSPLQWNKDFWRLISPAHVKRMLAERLKTKEFCSKLDMKSADYRVSDGHKDETAFGVCSLALIISRLEAVRRAKTLATTMSREEGVRNYPEVDSKPNPIGSGQSMPYPGTSMPYSGEHDFQDPHASLPEHDIVVGGTTPIATGILGHTEHPPAINPYVRPTNVPTRNDGTDSPRNDGREADSPRNDGLDKHMPHASAVYKKPIEFLGQGMQHGVSPLGAVLKAKYGERE